jgi:hypothetical protein
VNFVFLAFFLLCGCSSPIGSYPVMDDGRWEVEGKQYDVPYFVDNVNAKDCSYDDLLAFLKFDKTDQEKHSFNDILNSCERYSVTLHDNAERAGIRCGYVVITFKEMDEVYGRYGHALVVFRTLDRGPIFIDDTLSPKDVIPDGRSGDYSFDKIGEVIVGEKYIPRRLFNLDVLYKSMGTVESFESYWSELDR